MNKASSLARLEQSSIGRITISKSALVKIYLLIPLVWLVVLTDKILLHNSLASKLPFSPEDFFILGVFFGTPHILASSFTFFDREYFSLYKVRYYDAMVLLCIILPLIQTLCGLTALYTILLLFTIIHVVGQQLGLCIIMSKVKSRCFLLYKWLGLAISSFIYMDLYTEFSHKIPYASWVQYSQWLLLSTFTIAAIIYARQSQTKIGTLYIGGNYALVLSSWAFYKMQLSFFVMLTPRILHDLTAFMFYIAHDQNRNREQVHNWIYKPFAALGIPITILCPVLACTASYLLYITQQYLQIFTVQIYVSMLHYYTERFTWKHGTPHRREIAFQ